MLEPEMMIPERYKVLLPLCVALADFTPLAVVDSEEEEAEEERGRRMRVSNLKSMTPGE